MNAMKRLGLAALGFVALFGAAGCGADMAPPMAKSAPSEPMSSGGQGYGQPQPGAYQPGQPRAESAPPPPPASPSVSVQGRVSVDSGSSKKAERSADAPPSDRPGLGTQWGETRNSRISMVSFERADAASPFAAAAL